MTRHFLPIFTVRKRKVLGEKFGKVAEQETFLLRSETNKDSFVRRRRPLGTQEPNFSLDHSLIGDDLSGFGFYPEVTLMYRKARWDQASRNKRQEMG